MQRREGESVDNITYHWGCVFLRLDAVPADRVSPFRLRLRIALTEAGAIEGEGGGGGPLLSNLS